MKAPRTYLVVGVMLGGWLLVGCGTAAATEVITAVPITEEAVQEAVEEPAAEATEAVEEAEPTEEVEATEVSTVEEAANEEAIEATEAVDETLGEPSIGLATLPVAVFTANEGDDAGDSVWTWRPGGAPSMLAGGGSIVDSLLVSVDGEVAVFQRRRLEQPQTSSLWAVNTDGANERELLSAEDLLPMTVHEGGWGSSVTYIQFVPDTHTLLFATQTWIDAPGVYVNGDLWLLDADSGELSLLQAPSGKFQQAFEISPNGQYVATVSESTVSVAALDGSMRIDALLTYEPSPTGASYMAADMVWTADSSSLLVAVPPPNLFDEESLPYTLMQVPIDGSPAVELAQYPANALGTVFNGDGTAYAYQDEGASASGRQPLHIVTDNGADDEAVSADMPLTFWGWDQDNERYFSFVFDTRQLYVGAVGQEPTLLEGVVFNVENWVRRSVGLITDETVLYVAHTENRSAYALWQVTPGSAPSVVMILNGEPGYFIPRLVVAR